MLTNTSNSYGWIAIAFHWLSALAVFGLFALGYWMVDLDYYSSWYKEAPHLHKSIGLLLALLTLARIGWKIKQTTPKGIGAKWEIAAAHFTHLALYLLLLSIFLTGYLISTADGRGIDVFNWFTLPSSGEWVEHQEDIAGDIHRWLAYTVIGLAILHAAAAIKHHVISKDNTLKRMLTPTINEDEE